MAINYAVPTLVLPHRPSVLPQSVIIMIQLIKREGRPSEGKRQAIRHAGSAEEDCAGVAASSAKRGHFVGEILSGLRGVDHLKLIPIRALAVQESVVKDAVVDVPLHGLQQIPV